MNLLKSLGVDEKDALTNLELSSLARPVQKKEVGFADIPKKIREYYKSKPNSFIQKYASFQKDEGKPYGVRILFKGRKINITPEGITVVRFSTMEKAKTFIESWLTEADNGNQAVIDAIGKSVNQFKLVKDIPDKYLKKSSKA